MARKMKNKFKIKHQPIPKMKQIEEPARRIPVRAEVDVLVVGAGPAGLMAAQAAALEKGTKVMLVESRGFLGGNMTIGLPLLGFLGRKGNVVIKGLPLQFVERLQEKGLATHHRACPLHVSLTMIDPEGTKHLAFQIIKECGIDLLMYAFATDVIMEGNTVKGVIIDSKKGREAILAKRVIDCTGDGDIAYRAGAPMNYGNEKGIPQPPTLMFSMRGVDSRKLRDAVADDPDFIDRHKADLCASLQHTIVEILLKQLVRAAKEYDIRDIAVAGGVSANSGLRNGVVEEGRRRGWRTFVPEFRFTTDNAAMIAVAGYYHYLHGDFSSLDVSPVARIEELM